MFHGVGRALGHIALAVALSLATGCTAWPLAATSAKDTDCCIGPTPNPVAASAVWGRGELAEHFEKHPETYRSEREYDEGARETIRLGARFTYTDTQTSAPRVGYFHKPSNRFTGLTGDEKRITTHFRPDRGERYVAGLPRSTYRLGS